MKTKLIAFYLPQFHTTDYNDKWWGEGFTEWTNTKKATPFFKGHYQPKEPLNDNYYCLMDEKVQEWQADLAKQYGIDGFCYYHYWFKGKLLLEKPMENMLKNKKIDLPFCISWANEPWTRSWTGKQKEVLMDQEYGSELDWKEHIDYLMPFFKDSRYILVDNKPVMLLYRSENITDCQEMIAYWNQILKEEGFNGIYIIETLTGHQKKGVLKNSEAQVEMEPMFTIRHDLPLFIQGKRFIIKKAKLWKMGIFDKINSDLIWKHILRRSHQQDKKTFQGAFVDWDNSARWGKKAMILTSTNPDKFEHYFSELYSKSLNANDDFIFFNAWNEWAEGTYLEPDKKYGFSYLERINKVKNCQGN